MQYHIGVHVSLNLVYAERSFPPLDYCPQTLKDTEGPLDILSFTFLCSFELQYFHVLQTWICLDKHNPLRINIANEVICFCVVTLNSNGAVGALSLTMSSNNGIGSKDWCHCLIPLHHNMHAISTSYEQTTLRYINNRLVGVTH